MKIRELYLTVISNGSEADASMEISLPKTMGMHAKERINDATDAEVEDMKFKHKFQDCLRTFSMQKGEKIHSKLWYDGGGQYSRGKPIMPSSSQREKHLRQRGAM